MLFHKSLPPGLFALSLLTVAFLFGFPTDADSYTQTVRVETVTPGTGPAVTRDFRYRSMVTLYIVDDMDKNPDQLTPSGWSTRQEHGAPADQPFEFQPGVNLIAGWTEGVLKMVEGERAKLFVPAKLGYGSSPMGNKNAQGGFYIPANSDLLFDIEILGKAGDDATEL